MVERLAAEKLALLALAAGRWAAASERPLAKGRWRIERDVRNVRRTGRKAERRNWYRILPWVSSLKNELQRGCRGAIVT